MNKVMKEMLLLASAFVILPTFASDREVSIEEKLHFDTSSTDTIEIDLIEEITLNILLPEILTFSTQEDEKEVEQIEKKLESSDKEIRLATLSKIIELASSQAGDIENPQATEKLSKDAEKLMEEASRPKSLQESRASLKKSIQTVKEDFNTSVNLSESIRNMVNRHKGQGGLEKSIAFARSFKPSSAYASRITIATDKSGKEYAFKEFTNPENARQEAQGLSDVAGLVDEVNSLKEGNEKFPHVAKYLGSSQNEDKIDILFEKASGEAISNILDTLVQKDEATVSKIFFNIGKQFGNLAYHYYKKGLIFTHPDDHGGNIFYDEKKDQVTLIDYAPNEFNEAMTLTPIAEWNLEKEPNFDNFPHKLLLTMRDYIWVLPQGSKINWGDAIIQKINGIYDKDELKRVSSSIQLYIIALKSIFEGYASVMPPEKQELVKNTYHNFVWETDLKVRNPNGLFYRRGDQWFNKTLKDFINFVNEHLLHHNIAPIDVEKYSQLS